MAETALKCPRFSATKIIATGAINNMALALKTGLWNVGRPNQAAFEIKEKSIALPKPMILASKK